MQEWIERLIAGLLEFTELSGYYILFLTVPLFIIQGVFTLFPFASLVLLHISTFGLIPGLGISWLAGSFASVVSFVLCRYFFYDWFERKLGKALARYEKWQKHMDAYGVWVIILLRTVPFVPNNIVSLMASVSPIRMKAYIWATSIGTFLHIWLFGLISSSLFIPDADVNLEWFKFAAFCLILLIFFLIQVKRHHAELKRRSEERLTGQ